MKRVIITGGAGFIGSALAHRLSRTNAEVLLIDSGETGDWRRIPDNCQVIREPLEALSTKFWSEALVGCDAVFHLAAQKYNSSKATPEKVVSTNISATARLFECAAKSELKRLVFSSSLYAYGVESPGPWSESHVPKPSTVYGASKVAGEHLLAALRPSGATWTALRLFFVYGPNQYAEGGYKSVILSNFERILAGQPPTIYGSGEQTLDYIYIDDCVNALLAAAERNELGFDVINVGTGLGTSINELTKLMQQVTTTQLEPMHLEADWTDGTIRVGEVSRMGRVLGVVPQTNLAEGLTNVWNWLRGSKE